MKLALLFFIGFLCGAGCYWLFDKKIQITIKTKKTINDKKITLKDYTYSKDIKKDLTNIVDKKFYKAKILLTEIKRKGKLPIDLSPAILYSLTTIANTPNWDTQLDDESLHNLNRIYEKWQQHIKVGRAKAQVVGTAENMQQQDYWEGTEEEYLQALEDGLIDENTKVRIYESNGWLVQNADGTVEETWDKPTD